MSTNSSVGNQSKEYIQNAILPYTSHHITADNYKTLQINAARSLKIVHPAKTHKGTLLVQR